MNTLYIMLDESDLVVGHGSAPEAAFDFPPPPGQRRVAVVAAPPSGPNKLYYKNEVYVDSGEPWHTPSYAARRAAAYPGVGEQLDMLWHAMDDGSMPRSEPFYSSIKAALPKPGI